jgi:hypothetical protein
MARVSGVQTACAFALAVRLGFVLSHSPYRHADLTDYSDYLREAGHMLTASSGPEDTFMPAGFPAWIALGNLLHLPPLWLPLWQVAAGVATVALVGWAVRRLTESRRAGAAAAWAAALYPPFVYYQGFLFSETTTAALVALAIAVATGGLTRGRDRAVVGLALGAAAVWRTNVALVPLAWAVGSFALRGAKAWARGPLPRVLGWAALPLVAAVLRASLLVSGPCGPSTNGGVNFLLAHSDWTEVHLPYEGTDSPGAMRVIHFFRNRRRAQEAVYQAPAPAFRERPLYAEALRSMGSDPGRELRRLPLAWLDGMGLGREGYYPRALWYDARIDADAWMEALRAPLGVVIVLPAIAWAAWRIRSRRKRVEPGHGLIVATIASSLATSTLYLSEPRMRVPFDPAFLVAALIAWTAVLARIRPATAPDV